MSPTLTAEKHLYNKLVMPLSADISASRLCLLEPSWSFHLLLRMEISVGNLLFFTDFVPKTSDCYKFSNAYRQGHYTWITTTLGCRNAPKVARMELLLSFHQPVAFPKNVVWTVTMARHCWCGTLAFHRVLGASRVPVHEIPPYQRR